jgi:hypothetical protein
MNYVSNRPVVKEFNNSGQAMMRRADRYFVERKDEGGWELTQPEDRFVSTDELGQDFGLWKDKEITEGSLWWKKVIRPKDGKIDQDEVLSMGEVMRTGHDSFVDHPYPNRTYRRYDRLQASKTELNLQQDGGTLHTDWTTQFRHTTQNDWGTVSNRHLAD